MFNHIINHMKCPNCHHPQKNIRILNGTVICPSCLHTMIEVGNPTDRDQFLADYQKVIEAKLDSVAAWFAGNKVAAGVFLAWLGERLAKELQ